MHKSQFVALIFTALLLSCNQGNPKQDEHTESTTENPAENLAQKHFELSDSTIQSLGFQFGPMESREIRNQKQWIGTVIPGAESLVQVHSKLLGTIKSIQVQKGQFVRAGQVLALFESPALLELQSQYLLEKAEFAALDLEWNRQQRLGKESLQSPKDWEVAQQKWTQSQVRLATLSTQLRSLGINPTSLKPSRLTALLPIQSTDAGQIQEIQISKGSFVAQGQEMFKLAQMRDPKIEILVRSDFDPKQDQLLFTGKNGQEKELLGAQFLQIADADGNRKLILPLPKGEWAFGQKLQIQVVRAGQAQVLPTDAIVSWRGGNYAFGIKSKGEQELRAIPVQIISRDGRWTQIQPLSRVEDRQIWLKNKAWSAMALFENQEEGGHH